MSGVYTHFFADSSLRAQWKLHILTKYGNFIFNIQNFDITSHILMNEYQKSNCFLKEKVICQNSSQTVLTPVIIWELLARKSADKL